MDLFTFINRDTQNLLRQVSEGWTQKESPEENHFFRSLFDKQHPLLNTDFTHSHFNSPQITLLINYPSFISAPIFGRQGVLGLISFFSSKSTAFNHEELSLLTSVANHISIAVENNRLHQKADEAIVIEERQRLARELHDSISQLLYSQLLFSQASLKLVHSGDTDLLTSYLHRLSDVADQAFKEMRLMIYSLRPKVLESVGLSGALQHRLNTVEQRAGMETKFSVIGVDNLPSQVEDGLFRIAQEALNNALKHASATAITVRLEQDEPFIELEVSDNGIGFEREAIVEGIGIASMQERAKQLGGDLIIASTPGMGTSIRVKINYSNVKKENKMSNIIGVLIVDDHAIVREGLRAVIGLENDMQVVGEAKDGNEAISLSRHLNPDVILMDLLMPNKGGIEAIREILEENPNRRILVLTSFAEVDKISAHNSLGRFRIYCKKFQPR